jgi:hypothetical protein
MPGTGTRKMSRRAIHTKITAVDLRALIAKNPAIETAISE